MAGESTEIVLGVGPVAADLAEEREFLEKWRRRLAEASQSILAPYTPDW
jgi:hypothetical protein